LKLYGVDLALSPARNDALLGAVLILSGSIQKIESSMFALVIVKSFLTRDLFVKPRVYAIVQ
jgi:hypothetical protein